MSHTRPVKGLNERSCLIWILLQLTPGEKLQKYVKKNLFSRVKRASLFCPNIHFTWRRVFIEIIFNNFFWKMMKRILLMVVTTAKPSFQLRHWILKTVSSGWEAFHRHLISEEQSTNLFFLFGQPSLWGMVRPGNTKEGSITVPLTSCLTGLESAT